MALPPAVQRELDAADEIVNTLVSEGTEGTPVGDTPAPAPAPVTLEPAPAASTAEQPAPAVVAPPKEDFEQKYRILQGKYNAEVPRLQRENQDLKHTLQQKTETQPEPQPTRDAPLVDKKDAEDFGSDLMDAVARMISHAVDSLEARLRAEYAPVKQEVRQVVQQQADTMVDTFWAKVEKLVPDWKQIDGVQGVEGTEDPRWVQFLNSAPKGSVLTNRQLAGSAIESGNADKIAELVALWKTTLPTAVESVPPQPPAAPKPGLERQVSPNSSRGAPPGPVVDPEQWSLNRYEAAYDPRNPRTMGPEAAAVLMADADRALAEGRVQLR